MNTTQGMKRARWQARGPEPRRARLARAGCAGGGGSGRGDRHHGLAHRGAQHDEHEPGAGRVGRRRSSISARPTWSDILNTLAAGLPELRDRLLEHVELAVDAGRADDGQPARPRAAAHAGAGRRTAARHGDAEHGQSEPGPEPRPDPGGARSSASTSSRAAPPRSTAPTRSRASSTSSCRKTSRACRSTRSTASTSTTTATASCRGWPTTRASTSPTAAATDGENLSVSVIGGTNIADDRGNFTAYLTYRQADPINGLRP